MTMTYTVRPGDVNWPRALQDRHKNIWYKRKING